MKTRRNILTLLAIVGGVTSLAPANADYITKTTTYIEPVTSTTTYVAPAPTMQIVPAPRVIVAPTTTIVEQSYETPAAIMPAQTVRTTETTVTTTTPDVRQTILSEPETIRRSLIMMGSKPASASSETTSSAMISPFPVYGNRLASMNEQIDRSVANGWITTYQAENLRADSSRLGQMILNRSESKADINTIERGLTGLNISIQEAMRANGKAAGLSTPTF